MRKEGSLLGLFLVFALFSTSVPSVVTANQAPVIEPTPTLNITVGEHLTYQLHGSDPDPEDAKNLTWGLVEGPYNMNVSDTGLLEWVPESSHAGFSTIIVKLSDGKTVTTDMFTIKVDKKEERKEAGPTYLDTFQMVGAWFALGALCILAFVMRLKYGFRRRPLWVLFGPKE